MVASYSLVWRCPGGSCENVAPRQPSMTRVPERSRATALLRVPRKSWGDCLRRWRSALAIATPTNRGRRRRADADRTEAAILDAAIDALASDPDASMVEIARRTGVVRATVYVHFPTHEALIAAITDRAIADATDAIRATPPARATPPMRLPACSAPAGRHSGTTTPSFRSTLRLGPEHMHAPHQPILRHIRPLLRDGQASGALDQSYPWPGC